MDLVPVWNGAMERAGTAPGLSNYSGRSHLFHSPNWERLDALEHGECKQPHGKRGHDRKPRSPKASPVVETRALDLLQSGMSYGAIARELGISMSVPRRVAKRHGIDRSTYAGANRFAGQVVAA